MKRRVIAEVYEKNVSGSRTVRKQGISDKPGGRISSRINNRGMGTVEMILIIVEKPNAKHRYVLCGN